MESEWRLTTNNDTGPTDEGFWMWWEVTNDMMIFKCDNEDHARWLLERLLSK